MQSSARYRRNVLIGVRNALFGLLVPLLLAACGSNEEPKVAAPTPQVKRQQAPEDPTAKMARAVTVGGATAPVNLRYEIVTKPVVGAPVEIELFVIPTQGADSMTVSFVGSSGLTVSAEAVPQIDVVKSGQAETVKFSVQAQQETVYYVTVTATMYSAGVSTARNFAIPIIMSAPGSAVEPAAPAPAAAKKS
jgi:hypothetical protein